jgi:hypothetical protein
MRRCRMTMPHCFAMVIADLPASRKFFNSWAAFITMATTNPEEIETKGTVVTPKTLKETEVDVLTLSTFTEEEVMKRMKERVKQMSGKQPDPMSKL